jgi:hypothetical protein
MVNLSLLAKWRWRLLDNNQAVWKDVLISKYGELAVGKVEVAEECKPWYASLWWRDICSVGSNLGVNCCKQAFGGIIGLASCPSKTLPAAVFILKSKECLGGEDVEFLKACLVVGISIGKDDSLYGKNYLRI